MVAEMKALLDADPRLAGSGMTSQRARDRLLEQLRRQGIRSEAVLEAMRYMPRHIFIDEALATHAYDNNALPIGRGQTISQPYIVALMSEAILLNAPKRVLEIGTGCGYQTAILAQLVDEVYTIERIEALSLIARQRLAELRIGNVRFRYGDGYLGWPERSPFDAVIVTAAPPETPAELLTQLRPGGSLVIPTGHQHSIQALQRITRSPGGSYHSEHLCDVAFVPLKQGIE